MSSCPNSDLKQVLLGQVAQGLNFQNLTAYQGWKLYSPSGHLFPCLTILRMKKSFLVDSCCCSLSITADFTSSLPVREESWRRPQNQGSCFLWLQGNVVSHRCTKFVRVGKIPTIWFTEVLLGWCFSTYSSCSDLKSVAAWLGWVSKLGKKLADKLMPLKNTCVPDLLRDRSQWKEAVLTAGL